MSSDYAEVQEVSLESLGAAPLTIDYWLVPLIDFRTTVTGANRDNATVQIFYVNTPLWTGTLTNLQPNLTLPKLRAGSFTITDGGLALVVPGPTTMGSVSLTCTLTQDGQPPVKVDSLPVASWPLKSDKDS
ncbi:MAG: hypothetical protein QOK04_1078 [Solirubrobacteraceae bacterium]|jgi:hypothetical protein|nr:hypothetical protein [Solirubrobacteraceae bacterium]